jgi:hypothetical protein
MRPEWRLALLRRITPAGGAARREASSMATKKRAPLNRIWSLRLVTLKVP